MLIFDSARDFLVKLAPVKYAFIAIAIFSIAACDNDKNEIDVSKEDSDYQESPAQTQNEPVDDIISDGFYQEHTSNTPSSDTQSNDIPTADTPSLDEAQTQQDTAANPDAIDKKSIVEDLGFSQAQEQPDEPKENVEAPFCLDSKNVPQDQESIKDACQRISKRLASVKYEACEAAKLQLTGCSSVKGFPILLSDFPPVKDRKPQGRILIVGGTHGDELTSVSVVIRWIEKLNRHHSGLFHWHLVPMMNPDGVLKRGATRTNENGVDLNRNMPSDDWSRNALKYWVEKGGKDPRKYPGEAASSEPETQWLIDEINSFKPDAIISVHAPYGVVDFDSLLLKAAPKSLGKLHLNLLGTYPGSLGNYAGINLNIPVITLELPHSWEMPSEAESTKIWEDIVSWLKKNVNKDVAAN